MSDFLRITSFLTLWYPVQSRILLSVLSFRLNQRYVEGNPPFIAIDIDVSDSAREGCVVSTLTITSEPKDWRGAVQVCPALCGKRGDSSSSHLHVEPRFLEMCQH